jgi:Domain of unknown function (DUF397)
MDVRGAEWRRARRSSENGGACVEVAVWETDERSA